MPITLTVVGTTLNVSVVDDNMVLIQDLLRSGLVKSDIANDIKRINVRRYTSGRLISSTSYANPIIKEGDTNYQVQQSKQVFDLQYRPGRSGDGDMTTVDARVDSSAREHHARELLGRPGPSFYFQWQEDGFPDPPTQYGGAVAGWPPTGWPYDRYDRRLCFSKWLTIPGASQRVYIKYPCTVRVTGQTTGSWTMFAMMRYLEQSADPDYAYLLDLVNRYYAAFRFGLIVDTNPVLDTEFPNTNPNILDPEAGGTAPYVSWKVLSDRTHYAAQRETVLQKSEVFLQGGKEYNFRFAMREAGTHGFVGDIAGVPTWNANTWENGLAAPPAPVHTLWPVGTGYEHPFHPPWISLFDASQLSLELDYGRSGEFASSYGSSSIQNKGSYP